MGNNLLSVGNILHCREHLRLYREHLTICKEHLALCREQLFVYFKCLLRNLKIGYFSQHHVDQLDLNVCSVELLLNRFPGMTEPRLASNWGFVTVHLQTGRVVFEPVEGNVLLRSV